MSRDNRFFSDLKHVEAELNYLTPMAEKLVNYAYEPPAGVPRSNGKYETHKVPIRNAREISDKVSLERQGFDFTAHKSKVSDFYDEDEIRSVYYPEAKQLLKEVTGATEVLIFDHTLRNAQISQPGENEIREPVKRVHNDFTAKSGYTRARKVLTEQGIDNIDQALQKRFALINIWRPIAPVQESPLAVCDALSIAPTDLVAGDLLYPNYAGETYSITYNPSHQWFYFPQMQQDEALFIKCFDSAEDGRARFAGHTGFDDPTSPSDAPPRQSIELRTVVFYRF
ncbi:MAG: CmcJ/NvfI family oxidoreductase [Nostoc sp.]|uniref:CmcJ/NvfI family oxidoreductase n=1 Tax=Nostoc sp. TaxID=1180 RepID=UPI002FEF31B2